MKLAQGGRQSRNVIDKRLEGAKEQLADRLRSRSDILEGYPAMKEFMARQQQQQDETKDRVKTFNGRWDEIEKSVPAIDYGVINED